MATVRCRYCHEETDGALTTCERCGQPLRASGLMAYLKPRSATSKSTPSETVTVTPRASNARAEAPAPPAQKNSLLTLPASAVVFFNAPEFFAVRVSGERSVIARLFGSALDLPSLCSAMLFSAYASLVQKGNARLQVAAVTPTGALVFPIRTQWIKLIFETLTLARTQPTSLEGMLMARASTRLTSSATQQLLADLIEWEAAPAPRGQLDAPEAVRWNRHYAEALTAVVRHNYGPQAASRAAVEQTEAMLAQFCERQRQAATYLSHEISLIVHWLASRQDLQLQQRHSLLAPHAPNILNLSPSVLHDDEYWRTIAQYARRSA